MHSKDAKFPIKNMPKFFQMCPGSIILGWHMRAFIIGYHVETIMITDLII